MCCSECCALSCRSTPCTLAVYSTCALPASLAYVGPAIGCPGSVIDALPIAHSAQHQLLQDDFDEERCPEGFTLQGAVPEATQAAAQDASKPGPSTGELSWSHTGAKINSLVEQ